MKVRSCVDVEKARCDEEVSAQSDYGGAGVLGWSMSWRLRFLLLTGKGVEECGDLLDSIAMGVSMEVWVG